MDGALAADIVDLKVAEHGSETRVVTVTGELDSLTGPMLAATLAEQLEVAQTVVVDLDGVQFLASAGLGALFDANEIATRQNRDLRLVCNSPSANRSLTVSGLRDHFAFADSVPHALN
jgi:anti-sigma B factor antagonist